MPLLSRNHLQFFDSVEMPAVVGQQDKPVPKGCCPDEEIEIANQRSLRSQPATLLTKNLTYLLIHKEQGYRLKEITQTLLASLRVARVENAFVEFGERND